MKIHQLLKGKKPSIVLRVGSPNDERLLLPIGLPKRPGVDGMDQILKVEIGTPEHPTLWPIVRIGVNAANLVVGVAIENAYAVWPLVFPTTI